jgi:hypothetical protein
LLTVLAFAGCVERVSPATEQGKEDGPSPVRKAECRWASGPITIDGKADEPAWKDAQVLELVVNWQKRKAKTATKARLLWDDKYLYFTADMEDSDLYADIKEHNGMLWFNDVFELFFKPRTDKLPYYEFQVNAANAQLELFFPSRGSGGYHRAKSTTKYGMQSAVTLNGTLNDWTDQDKGWTVEGRIPLSAFGTSGDVPQAGSKWRFALCRYDYSAAFEEAETSSSAPLTRPDFHRYEDYGELTFVKGK